MYVCGFWSKWIFLCFLRGGVGRDRRERGGGEKGWVCSYVDDDDNDMLSLLFLFFFVVFCFCSIHDERECERERKRE